MGLPATKLGTAFPDPLNVPPGCPFNPRCPKVFDRCRVEVPLLAPHASGTVAACHLA
jgi:oligopeptide/dipeptide ABC transporter ATP-binding protein